MVERLCDMGGIGCETDATQGEIVEGTGKGRLSLTG